jgi:hypothetical protein
MVSPHTGVSSGFVVQKQQVYPGAGLSKTYISVLCVLCADRELLILSCSCCVLRAVCVCVQVSELVRLRVVDVCGCEGVTSASLQHLATLTALTHLNMEQCPGLKGNKLHHIAGRLRGAERGGCNTLQVRMTHSIKSATDWCCCSCHSHGLLLAGPACGWNACSIDRGG